VVVGRARAVARRADPLSWGVESRTIQGLGDDVQVLMCSPDGSRLLGADDSGALKIWDPATGREIAATTLAGCLYTNTIRYRRDGALVAGVGHRVPVMTGEVRILDAGRACVLAAVERLPLARVGPTSMRKPLSRPARDDRGTSQTPNRRHLPWRSAVRVYAVAPIQHRGVAMRHVGPRDATWVPLPISTWTASRVRGSVGLSSHDR